MHCSTFIVDMSRVLCLLVNPSSLATPLLDSQSPLNLVVTMLCYENVLLVVKEKQLNLMNHLGGIGRNGFMLSGYSGAISMVGQGISLVDGHPGTKRSETPCSLAYRTATCYMGSGLTEYVVRTRILRARWWQRGYCRCNGARRERFGRSLRKSLVLVNICPFEQNVHHGRRADQVMWVNCTTSAECKTKYLAVSPVTDNLSELSRAHMRRSPHPNF